MLNGYRFVHNRCALSEQPTWSPPRADVFRLHGVRNSLFSQLFDRKPTQLSIWGCDILEEIGRGGMGTVYRAYDPALDRTLAIKLLTLPALDPNQLLAEAQAMARVSHPNVIRVYDAGLFEGHVFIVMEYISGASFRSWLSTPRPRAQILEKLVLAGRGLSAIHRSGLIHRDFKPGNILIGADGEVKIIDFGIAVSDTVAPSESSAGTLAYMSPEQLSGVGLAPKSDQFAYCTTLFEALAGVHPFAKPTAIATMTQILLGEAARPKVRLPGWLRAVLKRGLAKNPELRFSTMEALVAAVERGPIRRRRILQAVGGLAVVSTLVVALASTREVEDPCAGIQEKPDGMWGPKVEQEIALRHPDLQANPRWEPFRQNLRGYVEAWQDERVHACSDHQSRELTTASYAAHSECLEHGALQLSLVADQIYHSGELADATIETVDLLPVPSDCRNAAEFPELLEDDTLRRNVWTIRRDLQAAKTYLSLGEAEIAVDTVEGAYNHALELNYGPLVAEAKLAKGTMSVELQQGNPTQLLEEAYNIATNISQHNVAQEAAARLIFVYAEVTRNPLLALDKQQWAETATSFHPLDSEGRWLLPLNSGVAADRRGDYFAARQHYSEALNASEGLRHAVALYDLAILETAFGFVPEGIEALESALELLRDEYGYTHPYDPTFLRALVDIHLARGDIASGYDVFTQAYEQGDCRDAQEDCRYEREKYCSPEAIVNAAAEAGMLNLCFAKARLRLLEGDPEGLTAGADVLQAVRTFYRERDLLVAMMELEFDQPQFAADQTFTELKDNPQEQVAFHRLYAVALRNIGNLGAAHEHAKKATDLSRNLPDQPATKLATLLLEEGAIALDRGDTVAGRLTVAATQVALGDRSTDNLLKARIKILQGRIAADEQRFKDAHHDFAEAETMLLELFPSGWQEDVIELRRHRKMLPSDH